MTKSHRWGRITVLVSGLLAAGVSTTVAQESVNYVMERVTLGATADRTSSTSYHVHVTFGQEGPVGSVSFCNIGFFQGAGFWSIAGNVPVPIRLYVDRNASDPSGVDLSWSGSSHLFEIFRSEEPESIREAAGSIALTPFCSATDAPPGGGRLVYYLVEPAGR